LAAAPSLMLALPPCPGCAGGGEVNGLPCRECEGSSRLRAPSRFRGLRARLLRLADRASTPAGNAVGTALRWSAVLPALGGAAGMSYGLAAIVHSLVHRVPEVPAAVLVASVFLLVLDRRL